MDELNASLSRERRAKGVLLDCKKTIEKQKKESETLDGIIKYQLDQIKFKDAEIEKLKSTFAGYENFKENERQLKAIAEAREMIEIIYSVNKSEKAKAWLEQNK